MYFIQLHYSSANYSNVDIDHNSLLDQEFRWPLKENF